jgi:tetratricopeptide (TPR) repeat protein
MMKHAIGLLMRTPPTSNAKPEYRSSSQGVLMILGLFSPLAHQDEIRHDLHRRIQNAASEEWAELWRTDVLILDGRTEGAISRLTLLTASHDRKIVMSAWLSLGQYHEFLSEADEAERAFRNAFDQCATTAERGRALINLSRVLNNADRPAETLQVASMLMNEIHAISPDLIQHLMIEIGKAFLMLDRRPEAESYLNSMVDAFPSRAELPLIRDHLLNSGRQG